MLSKERPFAVVFVRKALSQTLLIAAFPYIQLNLVKKDEVLEDEAVAHREIGDLLDPLKPVG